MYESGCERVGVVVVCEFVCRLDIVIRLMVIRL